MLLALASTGQACVALPVQWRNSVAWLELCRPGQVRKTSRRDLPHVMANKLTGAPTVSAPMLLAARAGIAVFVTGGEWPGL